MTAIVIAYEDDYFEQLHHLIKGLRRDSGLPALILEPRTVRGTGSFINEVPKLLRAPIKQTRLPPDRVVCLADADRPKDLFPGAPEAPSAAADLEPWLKDLETSWLDYLVREAHIPVAAVPKLRVICLRWNKESVLLASPEALLEHAGDHKRWAVHTLLAACEPCPTTLERDEDFILRYRKPGTCLDNVFKEIDGRRYKKGRDDEDLLRDRISPNGARRAQVLRRCPDLGRLLLELV